MIRGRRQRRGPGPEHTGPTWLRFGFLLAMGEAAILVLLVVHADASAGARPAGDRLAISVSDVGRSRAQHALAPTTTTTVTTPTTTPPPPEPTTPVTTVPAVPATTLVVPKAPPPAAPTRGILPPAVPAADIAPNPDFLQSCSGSSYDDSPGCTAATLQAIANARSREGLPSMALPSNWAQLTPEEQLFVATNLERTVRGLLPLTAMASALDQAARQGAAAGDDPSPPGGFPSAQWGSNWAGAVGNPLEAVYLWMYDDGVGSANVDCTASNQSGCWGHRQNVLVKLPCQPCVMGTGWVSTGYGGDPSMAELLVETSGNPAVDFTWQQESAYLP